MVNPDKKYLIINLTHERLLVHRSAEDPTKSENPPEYTNVRFNFPTFYRAPMLNIPQKDDE